ncbi:hypothetical protein [uncultured Mameliella sp.]|uniref:hypothetical protein n=1 Tax=uncultured Mameliella sp. TaxID=1447087 RepID=UPI0026228086|nr:hypothetical protein [uncultured Mameliella sp.]
MAGTGETLDQIKGDTPWTKAEERLIAEAPNGFVDFGEGCPEDCEDAPRIRAPLIRHLVTGGCADLPLPDRSVAVQGAVITGLLDLEAVKSSRDLSLFDCRFLQKPDLDDAELGGVYLPGCALPGLRADRLKTDRNLHLRNGFRATGEVTLRGARITGQLSCTKGRFENPGGVALDCDSLQVGAHVFLTEEFHATGEVDLRGARITGHLACIKGRFENSGGMALNCNGLHVGGSVFLRDEFHATGEVNLVGARITGQLTCIKGRFENPGGMALDCEAVHVEADVFLREGFHAEGLVNLTRAHVQGHLICQEGRFDSGLAAEGLRVEGALFWRGLAGFSGPLNFNDAHLGRLCDDAESWRGAKPLRLSGFRYERLDSGMSVAERLTWLSRKAERRITPAIGKIVDHDGNTRLDQPPFIRGANRKQCDPQPYTQLAKVLREQGMPQGAARILEERDKRVRRASYHRAMAAQDGTFRAGWAAQLAALMRPVNGLFGAVFGFGHRPGRAIYWVLGLWIFATLLYAQVWAVDQMAPESAIILTSADWIAAVECYEDNPTGPLPLALWKGSPTAKDYETFNAILYALDVFIPLDALGQEAAWAPSPVRGNWGAFGFWAKPALQVAGWIITAVGAAAVAGLVGRKD